MHCEQRDTHPSCSNQEQLPTRAHTSIGHDLVIPFLKTQYVLPIRELMVEVQWGVVRIDGAIRNRAAMEKNICSLRVPERSDRPRWLGRDIGGEANARA